MPKNPLFFGLAAVVVLLTAVMLYRACIPGTRLSVEPHAGQEIDKAKGR